MPVFIVLYRVLHKLTQTNPDGTFNPSYVSHDTQLYKDLSTSTQMLAFGLDLSHSAAKELGESFVGGLPYLVLVLMVTCTSYYQQRQISARNTSATVNPQQQMLMRIMPAFFAVISLTLPAGVVVYFLVSNLYRIGQQGSSPGSCTVPPTRRLSRPPAARSMARAPRRPRPLSRRRPSRPRSRRRRSAGGSPKAGATGPSQVGRAIPRT